MRYELDISRGVEVELNHDVKHWLHGVMVCFEFKTHENLVASRGFILPGHYEDLVSFLFDISLTKTIEHAFRHDQVCAGEHYLSAYEFHLVDSKDGQTNITPEFMEVVSRWRDELKKGEENGNA